MPSNAVINCARLLAKKQLNIAFVESATAGKMCYEFSLTPYSGDILRGGISCYEVFVKENIIKVPHALIEKYTPESAEVTEVLAIQSSRLFKSDITVAITGLASSGGSETKEKPVGTMFFHVMLPSKSFAHREIFKGNPEEIIAKAIDRCSELIMNSFENSL